MGWPEYSFEDLFDFSNGLNADRSAFGSGVPFANTMEVIRNAALAVNALPGRMEVSSTTLSRYRLRFGDVLFNRTSETQDEAGLSSVYMDDAPAVFGGFIFRAHPKTSLLNSKYAMYALRSSAIRKQILPLGQGGIRANISQRDLKKVRISLPPLSDQHAISRVLGETDELIFALERIIAKKQAIKQGMMQQLLTGKTRLPEFSGSWRHVKLGEVASMGSGGTPSSKTAKYYGGSIPWVSIADMTSTGKYVKWTEKTLTQEGMSSSAARLYDPNVVLYAMYASLGECSIAVGRVSSSQAILGISPGRSLDREFLYYYLTSIKSIVKDMGQQGTQSNLNAGMVRNFDLQLPPLDEQFAISAVLIDIDNELEGLARRLELTRSVKQGMMHELLTGRTRLQPVEAKS